MTATTHLRAAPLLVAPAAAGALAAAAAGSGRLLPSAALLAAVLVAVFVAWPWAVLPGSIVGGATGVMMLGPLSVSHVVVLHGGILGAGLLALAVRALLGGLPARRRTVADAPMMALAALVALGCLYGMARGNATHAAVVAGYHVGVIPAYYWIATVTLGEQAARRRAAIAFLLGATALAAVGLGMPGRHGGLLSALALVPTLSAAARQTRVGPRYALLGCCALLGVDVVLAAYRSVWLAASIALIIVAVRGTRAERRIILVASVLTVTAGIAAVTLTSAAPSRLVAVQEQLEASAGYRLPEATVGLRAFVGAPLLGEGLGQVAPATYLPDFRVGDVGPVYHVFYVTVLANGGALLLVALLASVLPALVLVAARRPGPALPWAALVAGFSVAAAFSGPTDGHWELGLLPALALLAQPQHPGRRGARRTGALDPPRAAQAAVPDASPVPGTPAGQRAAPACQEDASPITDAGACQQGILAVVVTYESREDIAACLGALNEAVDRIVVVDNASRDDTLSLVRERFPAVDVIANRNNVGFAAAVNQGLAGAAQETVMLVNPDCVLAPDTASVLSEHLRRHPEVGIAAPRLLDSGGAIVHSVHPFETLATVVASRFGASLLPTRIRRLLSWGGRRAAYQACHNGREPITVDWASGACLAIRGDLLRRLGGLDEGYFMYYEDEELCLQARQLGAAVNYVPSASAQHVGGASSSEPAAVWPSLYASMLRFFARHRAPAVPALRMALVLRAAIGVALATARREPGPALAWLRIGRLALGPVVAADGRRP